MKCEILSIPLKLVSDHLSVLFLILMNVPLNHTQYVTNYDQTIPTNLYLKIVTKAAYSRKRIKLLRFHINSQKNFPSWIVDLFCYILIEFWPQSEFIGRKCEHKCESGKLNLCGFITNKGLDKCESSKRFK